MNSYRGVGLWLAAAASVALASSAHSAPVEPAHLSLSFLRFNVSDLPTMQAFYQKAFGLQVQKRIDSPTITEVILTNPKGLDLALLYSKDKHKITLGNANGAIGFYLKDVDAAYQSALAAGATTRSAPGGTGGLRVAIVTDPEGHDIELLHLP